MGEGVQKVLRLIPTPVHTHSAIFQTQSYNSEVSAFLCLIVQLNEITVCGQKFKRKWIIWLIFDRFWHFQIATAIAHCSFYREISKFDPILAKISRKRLHVVAACEIKFDSSTRY